MDTSAKRAMSASRNSAIDKEGLDTKIRNNEDLTLKLESSLSNQLAERNAYLRLTEETAKLKKHHDDMKAKFDVMEGSHSSLVTEAETLRNENREQKETIFKLETEILRLKTTQGGDDNMRNMQQQLIRLSKDQEEKDKRIQELERELEGVDGDHKDFNSNSVRSRPRNGTSSQTCTII